MKICDTSVLADIDRGGVDGRVARLDDEGRHAISIVTVTELRLGVDLQYDRGTDRHGAATDDLDRLLSRFDIHPISRSVATTAASMIATLRARGDRLDDLHDIYIAATARAEDLPVITANVGDFERIDDLRVVDWDAF